MADFMATQVFRLHKVWDDDICEDCGTDIAVVDFVAQTVTIEIPSCFGGQHLHFTFPEFLEKYSNGHNRMLWWDDDLFEVLYDTVEEEPCS